ncbi:MAG: serine hydrolase [Bacillota bacterium]|nr:serine hydrolase [Bacillota bacterium]
MSEAAFLAGLTRRLESKIRDCDGLAGIHVVDLTTGNRFGVNDDLTFAVASSIKVPLLVSLYRKAQAGELDVTAPLTVDERHHVGGSGVLQYFPHPATLSIEDVAVLMINLSDNTATNILIDLVGMDYVNRQMDGLGLPGIRLRRKMIDSVAAARGDENVSPMRQAAELMRMLWAGEIVDQYLCESVLRILTKPKSPSWVATLLPPEVEIASKPGWLDGVACDFAIVKLQRRPYVFCCAVNYSLGADPAGFVAQLSHEVYRFFSVLDRSTSQGRRLDMATLLAHGR